MFRNLHLKADLRVLSEVCCVCMLAENRLDGWSREMGIWCMAIEKIQSNKKSVDVLMPHDNAVNETITGTTNSTTSTITGRLRLKVV